MSTFIGMNLKVEKPILKPEKEKNKENKKPISKSEKEKNKE